MHDFHSGNRAKDDPIIRNPERMVPMKAGKALTPGAAGMPASA